MKFVTAIKVIRNNHAITNTENQHKGSKTRKQKLLDMNAQRKGQKRNKSLKYNNVIYSSLAEASRSLGMDKRTIQKKCEYI